MHDGQSVTLQDAIDRHRGEARFVRQRYMTELSDSEKADLLAFGEGLPWQRCPAASSRISDASELYEDGAHRLRTGPPSASSLFPGSG
jgi:hypothetical protein